MMERVGEIAGVLDHLDDLDSDFSRFHRVDDFRSLSAPVMFARALRLAAYGGVMAIRVQALRESEPEEQDGADVVSSDLHTLTTHPGLSGLIEIGG